MEECCCQKKKSTPRDEESKKAIVSRINKIVGQMNGVKKMIEEDRYCDDVLIQLSAIDKSIKSLANIILDDHMHSCLIENIKNGIVEKITAAVDTVKNVFTKISDTVSSVWDKIKSLLKAPKIVQTGTVTVMGVDTPIPKFGLDWNAKGGIMTRPTAFGFANGKIQMGGEAGAEAILPLSAFWRNLQAYTENSQKKSQGNNDININVTINAENANEEEMAARFINIVVPEIKRQYAIL